MRLRKEDVPPYLFTLQGIIIFHILQTWNFPAFIQQMQLQVPDLGTIGNPLPKKDMYVKQYAYL